MADAGKGGGDKSPKRQSSQDGKVKKRRSSADKAAPPAAGAAAAAAAPPAAAPVAPAPSAEAAQEVKINVQPQGEKPNDVFQEEMKHSSPPPQPAVIPERKFSSLKEYLIYNYGDKGTISNFITLGICIVGLILTIATAGPDGCTPVVSAFVFSLGLFGFAGGVTNWLAVKMLFDKIPFLIGSGIIPRQFKAIREQVKKTIMKSFFDPHFLERYLTQKAGSMMGELNIDAKIQEMLNSDVFDQVIDAKLEELSQKPEGMWLAMMGLAPASLKPMIKPFLLSMGSDLVPLALNNMSPTSVMPIERIRDEIDSLMTKKLEELTPEMVKKLMEDVMRQHLGWLIVWGNVFGGLIGVVSQAAGFGTQICS